MDWIDRAREAAADHPAVIDKAQELADQAAERARNDPSLVDKAKELGEAANNGAKDTDQGREAIDVAGRVINDQISGSNTDASSLPDLGLPIPVTALPQLVAGVIKLSTPRPAAAARDNSANPQFFAVPNNQYDYQLSDPGMKKFSATSSAQYFQTVVITVRNPDKVVMGSTVFKGQGEGSHTMKNELDSDTWSFRAMSASSGRPWTVRLTYWHSPESNGPLERSAAYEKASEDIPVGGDNDRNDTVVTIA